jgi:hypothetical protein
VTVAFRKPAEQPFPAGKYSRYIPLNDTARHFLNLGADLVIWRLKVALASVVVLPQVPRGCEVMPPS